MSDSDLSSEDGLGPPSMSLDCAVNMPEKLVIVGVAIMVVFMTDSCNVINQLGFGLSPVLRDMLNDAALVDTYQPMFLTVVHPGHLVGVPGENTIIPGISAMNDINVVEPLEEGSHDAGMSCVALYKE